MDVRLVMTPVAQLVGVSGKVRLSVSMTSPNAPCVVPVQGTSVLEATFAIDVYLFLENSNRVCQWQDFHGDGLSS
jgi:hypothetical protein